MIDKFIKQHKLKNIIFFGLLILLIFLALFPRSVEVLNQNPVFGFDQGREMLAAKNIIVDHKLILIGTELGAGSAGVSGLFHGPIYYYLLTIPFLIFKGDPAGATWLLFLFSLSSILAGYFLGLKILNKWAGLLVALLMSVSPMLISQARFLWSPYPVTLFIILSLYFTFFIKQKKINIFFAAFFAGFIYNFEFAIAIPMSIALLIYSIYIFRNNIKSYLILISGFFLAYLPMILFEIRHGFMGLRGILNYLLLDKKSDGISILTYFPGHINSFIYNFFDTFPKLNILVNYLLITMFVIFILYFFVKEKNKEIKKFITYIFILFLTTILIFSFLRNTVWSYYLTHLNIIYMFLFSYLCYSFYKLKNIKIQIICLLVVGYILFLGLISSIKTFSYDINDYGGTAKLIGKKEAIDFIYKDAKGKSFGLFVFSPPIYTYPYDYLTWWHGLTKYGYEPHKDKNGLFYLLIEKDNEKPWSHKGWIETVVKTGNVLWEKTLPNGFIIQKRVSDE